MTKTFTPLLLTATFFLSAYTGFAQEYDSCSNARNICEGDKVYNVNTSLNTDDNNVVTDCGGSFRKAAWFSFITQHSISPSASVNITLTNNSVSAVLNIALLDGTCGGSYTALNSACDVQVTGSSSTITLSNPQPDHKYYVLVGSTNNLPATFDITVNSASTGYAVIEGTLLPSLSADITSAYVCNLQDSLVTFTNRSVEFGAYLPDDSISYFLQVSTGPTQLLYRHTNIKPYTSPWYSGVADTTLNIYKLVHKDQGNDSIQVCLVANDLCDKSANNKSCKSYYIQRSDARFDSIPYKSGVMIPLLLNY